MAVAGKVAITPKGSWNANTSYQKLDFVFYNDSSYIALKPSKGITPTNTEYWMLSLQGASRNEIEGIISGDIQVGDAKTIDGHDADDFAASGHTHTASQIGLGKVNNTSDSEKPVSTAQAAAIDAAKTAANSYTDTKIANLVNGAPSTLDTLKELADAMEENNDVVSALNSAVGTKANADVVTGHIGNTSNPHGVTKSQVGLGNVPNVATNNQTPTYTVASADAELTSGEKLSVAFGKIAKAIKSLISHISDTTKHITSSERTSWNAKAGTSTATTSANGLMSSSDKGKLDSLFNENLLIDGMSERSITGAATMPNLSDYAKTLLASGKTQLNITFEAKSDVATNVDCYPRVSSGAKTEYLGVASVTTNWTVCSIVLTLPADNYTQLTIRSNASVTGGSSTAVVNIRNIVATVAKSASRLGNTSAIGSATNPVYIDANGVPVKTTYTLGKSVPSNAVFTDTTALSSMTGTLPVSKGGTGATDAETARNNLGITPANIGAAASSHGTHVSYGTSAKALGTSSAGTATTVSRSDHVHALPALTSCTGTLTVAKGGTGATTAEEAEYNVLAGIAESTSAITDNTRISFAYESPSTTTGRLYWRKITMLWDYIKSKADSVYAKASHGNHVPTTETANNAKFLRNDNTWQTVTPANIGAAASSHGTHVSFSTTAPVMDGTASVGSASTVARSDHKHPTDTSRAAASHTHKKSEITDFPTSMPASDVYSWAKASSKPSYTASEVGAASGNTVTFTTPASAGRYRIAITKGPITHNHALISVSGIQGSGSSAKTSHLLFDVFVRSGGNANHGLTVLSNFGNPSVSTLACSFDRIYIELPYTVSSDSDYACIEVYQPNAVATTYTVSLLGDKWSLEGAGTQSSTTTNKTLPSNYYEYQYLVEKTGIRIGYNYGRTGQGGGVGTYTSITDAGIRMSFAGMSAYFESGNISSPGNISVGGTISASTNMTVAGKSVVTVETGTFTLTHTTTSGTTVTLSGLNYIKLDKFVILYGQAKASTTVTINAYSTIKGLPFSAKTGGAGAGYFYLGIDTVTPSNRSTSNIIYNVGSTQLTTHGSNWSIEPNAPIFMYAMYITS